MGDDAAERFLDQVLSAATICRKQLANKIPIKRLTQEQWREYNNAKNCSICAKPFKSADKKVHNHYHLTGEYRGPAHNASNLNYCINPKNVKILCIIPNLKGILFLCYSYFYNCQFLKLILISYFYMILILIILFHSTNLVNSILQLLCMFSAK